MGKNQDPGSGIYIPDPQHCLYARLRFEFSYKGVLVFFNKVQYTRNSDIIVFLIRSVENLYCFGSGSGLDPDSIRSMDPDSESGSGSRRAKITNKN
jgi:hypothetical protein